MWTEAWCLIHTFLLQQIVGEVPCSRAVSGAAALCWGPFTCQSWRPTESRDKQTFQSLNEPQWRQQESQLSGCTVLLYGTVLIWMHCSQNALLPPEPGRKSKGNNLMRFLPRFWTTAGSFHFLWPCLVHQHISVCWSVLLSHCGFLKQEVCLRLLFFSGLG